jgi:uncharacterized membrane protein YhhN
MSADAPARPRTLSTTTLLGKHAGGVPLPPDAPAPGSPAFQWRGLAATACALLYTALFAVRWQHPSPLFLGLFPALYLSLPLKALPVLLLSSFARLPGVIPQGALAESSVSQYKLFMARGLLASAAGDVLLDLCEVPGLEDGAFVAGLLAFLSAHVLYAAGFFWTASRPLSALLATACALPCALVTSLLAPHILRNPAHAPLLGPVCIYVLVIGTMWYLSLVRDEGTSRRGYYLTACGATLFLVSDIALAWDKFAPPPLRPSGEVWWWFSQPKVVVMLTYYGAQSLLAHGAWSTTEGRPKAKRA